MQGFQNSDRDFMTITYMTLWSTSERSRFFLIPDERDLPSGNFELRTVTGRHQQVDESVLAEFEVSREEAKVWLKEQFGQMLSASKSGIMDSLKNWRSSQAKSPPNPDQTGAASEAQNTASQSKTATALSELDAFLSQSAEQVRQGSATSLEHLRAIATALSCMFEGAISSDPEGLEQAKVQSQILQDNLNALGIQTGTQLETLPERLHNLYFAEGQSQNFEDNAAELEAIANQIERTTKFAVRSIRAMAKQQRKHASS